MLIGFGAASFEIEVILKDGASDEILSKSHVSSLFVMGGLIGGVVGEDVFVEDLGRAIGGGVANAKKDSVRRKREEPIAARSGADGHETPGESIPAGGGPK
jgi:hypothetical protein